MALKKDNLPVNVDVDTEQGSSITYANEEIGRASCRERV